jgi:regulator of protease activity HflC (stomatin/prohibitin superfamily)
MATLFALFAISSFVVWHLRYRVEEGSDARSFVNAAGPAAIVWVVILALFTVGMSITVVGSRSVGIQTSFGKYRHTLSNGFQFTAPWSSIEEFPTRVQYLDLDSDHAVPVTFKGGGGGVIKATPRWKIEPSKAERLWKKFKTLDHVRDQLVSSSAKDSIRVVASKFTANEARSGDHLREIDQLIRADLNEALAEDGVIIDSISIKGMQLDKRSQASLDKTVAANNDIERAKAEQLRAKIDAETVKIRQQSGTLSPQGLQRYCLELVNNWNDDQNGPLPAGFNCLGTPVPFTVTNH